MLWTERYHPHSFEEIRGQETVVGRLASFAGCGMLPHVILTGPHGTGKSASIGCLARALYMENWEANVSIFETADLFSMGKSLLEQDDRYSHIYRKGDSLIVNFKHILKEYASIRPLDAEFKLMVFEDAHALPRDAQQALRRIMEQFSPTCRFVFTTTSQSAIIPPISSRCLPFFFSPVSSEIISLHLAGIRDAEQGEGRQCPDEVLDLISVTAQGDMRKAVLLLQVAMETGRLGDLFSATEPETSMVSHAIFSCLMEDDLKGAIRKIESLMTDYGLSGQEVCAEVRSRIRREYNDPALAIRLADAEIRMLHSNNEYIQAGAFSAGMREVLQ
jgi:replication factor C small subunit